MPWCSLALTQDKIMKSFSRPWKASTLAISTSFTGRKTHLLPMYHLHADGRLLTISNITIINTITDYFYKYLKKTDSLTGLKHLCRHLNMHPITTTLKPMDIMNLCSNPYITTVAQHVCTQCVYGCSYLVELSMKGTAELHVLHQVGALALIWSDYADLVRFGASFQ